jgi:hypothetical protein
MTKITTLHGDDNAPTRIERELFEAAFAEPMPQHPTGLPMRLLAEQMVALGVPTIARAQQVIDAAFAPGGFPPLDVGGKPSLQYLIQKHWEDMETMELLALIQKHHPAITIDEVIAELMRQGEQANAEAAALQRYRKQR